MNTAKVFIVGPIGDFGSEKRINADLLLNKVIDPIMRELNCLYVRAEQIMNPGLINDQIDHELRSADIVIADLRDLNPNVMYELGIRQALGLSCILMIPADQKPPFDLQNYRTISYPRDLEEVEQVKRHLKLQVQRELGKSLMGSEDRWLYWHKTIARIEVNVECRSIWIITPDLYHSTKCPFLNDVVQENLRRGITYTYIFPDTDQTASLLNVLRGIFSSYPDQLIERSMPKDIFLTMAVSHYLVFEPDPYSDKPTQVFLELPIKSREYWIEVDKDAASGFYNRFYRIAKDLPQSKKNGGRRRQRNKTEMVAESGQLLATKTK